MKTILVLGLGCLCGIFIGVVSLSNLWIERMKEKDCKINALRIKIVELHHLEVSRVISIANIEPELLDTATKLIDELKPMLEELKDYRDKICSHTR